MPVGSTLDPLSNVAEALLRQPSFDIAARHYMADIVQWRRELGLFNRVATNVGFHVAQYVVLLHYAQPPGRAELGATFSNILDICTKRGQCGSRAVRTILAALVALRLIDVGGAPSDRRIKLFAPTERLLTDLRRHIQRPLTCLDLIVGEPRYAPQVAADPGFLPKLMATSGRAYVDLSLSVTEGMPELEQLIELRGGCATIAALAHAELNGLERPSPQAIAHDFRISVSQARNVLEVAERGGLLTRRPDGSADIGRLVAQQKMMLARELALYAKFSLGLELTGLMSSS